MIERDLEAHAARIGVAAATAMTFYRALIASGLGKRDASRWTESWLAASTLSVQTSIEDESVPVMMHGNN